PAGKAFLSRPSCSINRCGECDDPSPLGKGAPQATDEVTTRMLLHVLFLQKQQALAQSRTISCYFFANSSVRSGCLYFMYIMLNIGREGNI
ncbi:MAG: hypothetical protein IJW70_11420, partial [Clostridia bacterium]|nr:hypothetical protein [Clostridia bacterium]